METTNKQTKQRIQPLTETVKNIFRELSTEPKQKNARLVAGWSRMVGERIAKKTTPKFGKSGVVVWVDNSALAFELSQRYGSTILKRLQNEFGEEEIKKVWFCVGGNTQTE